MVVIVEHIIVVDLVVVFIGTVVADVSVVDFVFVEDVDSVVVIVDSFKVVVVVVISLVAVVVIFSDVVVRGSVVVSASV